MRSRTTTWIQCTLVAGCSAFSYFGGSGDARAEEFDGVEFPLGERSFADAVVGYDVGDGTGVEAPHDEPEAALGPPDEGETDPAGVALGNATGDDLGALTVEFVDNRLIDADGADLYIFERGPAVEATVVSISVDAQTWYELGRIEGSTREVDLAQFPELPVDAEFRFVRLRDYPDGNTSPSPYAGPDIDAIGAIGSIAAEPPEGTGDGGSGSCGSGHDTDGGQDGDGDGSAGAKGDGSGGGEFEDGDGCGCRSGGGAPPWVMGFGVWGLMVLRRRGSRAP